MKRVGLFLAFLSSYTLVAQTKDGFYDTNNYDLRQLPGYDPEGNVLPDVNMPPVTRKPSLVTPKNAKTQFDPVASVPGAGSFNPNNPTAQQVNPQALLQNNKAVFNPLTGEVNPQALQESQMRAKNRREATKKLREEFDDEAVYEESPLRRASIIFFLTFPFALGVSFLTLGAIPVALQKGIEGSAILFSGSFGLSGYNVYLDKERIEAHRESKNKSTNTSVPGP